MFDLNFYKDKRVFVTGHTGFKGTWLCKILTSAGAIVTGYSIDVPTSPSLFQLSEVESTLTSIKGDVRDFDSLKKAFDDAKPEFVFHLAAQPLVIESYNNPRYTYETNVLGTVNILECIRMSDTVKSFVNVTTDKVYKNEDKKYEFKEDDELNGLDPYSNSKSCSELVTSCYKNSFFKDNHVKITTMRAGNVIGGGDFASNRIMPDCIKAAMDHEQIEIRNPNSVRPFQHVLEACFSYLLAAKEQTEDDKYIGNYNIGPNLEDCISTSEFATIFCKKWGEDMSWVSKEVPGPHEAGFLRLNCTKIKEVFNWEPCWNVEAAIEKTVDFTKRYQNNETASSIMDDQINEYLQNMKF